ncbi:InlB B-repeat-containing protein [Isobaculum melis]|uniref:LPXTG-motif cell wall anchor domain-containing protein/Listeria/Bacterioides repeat-containing protein n=1 Tax=Isobaculum melis TaxID=142588 RepID=A0A1H9SXN2_9LACT|nr:InlB B-repeat-containing protein [Isobaculum melis]SER89199.1 LPXTG-motif cell wall anchor domain-containing protein/Listeria/Bacterioides repeat-containing protein [Isobaculum melis]
MKQRNWVKTIITIAMIVLLTLSQTNIYALANVLDESKDTDNDLSTIVDSSQQFEQEEQLEIEPEQLPLENNPVPEIKEDVPLPEVPTIESQPKSTTPFAVFGGIAGSGGSDLAGQTALEYDISSALLHARSLDISAKFGSDHATTNRKIIIHLNNGLGIAQAPGMIATSKDNNDWIFSSTALESQYQGVITNATYTPNESIYGYNPKGGTLIYEISHGTANIDFSLLLTFDLGFGANDGRRSFENILEVSSSAELSGIPTIISDEKIESYTVTGKLEPWFYRRALEQIITPGDEVVVPYRLSTAGSSFTNSRDEQVLYDEYVQTFYFKKELGFQKLDNPNNFMEESQLSYSVDSVSDPDHDIVTLTIQNFATSDRQLISFYFSTAANIEPGNYTIQATESRATPYQSPTSLELGKCDAQIIKVAAIFENKLIPKPTTGRVFNTPSVLEATNYPLGVYHFSNSFAENVTDQKIRLTFDDPAIGVTYVQLVTGQNQDATNVTIKTNKDQYTIERIPFSKNFKLTGVANLDLTDYTSDPEEFIKEIIYESTEFLPGSGTNGTPSVSYSLWSSTPGVFYGKFFYAPESKLFESTLSTVAVSDGDLDGPEANHSIMTTTVSNNTHMTFRHNNLLSSLDHKAGDVTTLRSSLTISKEELNGAFVKKGFDLYLREGDYLQINPESIVVKQGTTFYRVEDGTITPIETVDNTGNRVIKFTLNDVTLGVKNGTEAHPPIELSYDVKIKNETPATTINTADLLAIIPSNGDTVTVVGNTAYFNTKNKFDIDGSGDTNKLVGTLNKDTTLKISAQKEFSVSTAANLNDGPWTSYDYYTGKTIIDLNPKGRTNYQLTVANNTGKEIDGYTALIPVPKAGEQTDLTPDTPAEFNQNDHLQKEAFGWTTSILDEIVPVGNLNYEVLYATTYEIEKDSPQFKAWNEIENKEEIRMVKISTTDTIPNQFTEAICFPLNLDDPKAEINAGKANIYSARIYRAIPGAVSGYKPSDPIAIRLKTGVIKGQVFNDTNRNGIKDAEENGRSGVTVRAYETGTNKEIYAVTTDKDGYYEFLGLDKNKKVDILFINPTTNDETRFSPPTSGGSTPTESGDHLQAIASNLVPSATNFDQIDAGIIEPTKITLNPVGGTTANTIIKRYPGDTIVAEPSAIYPGTDFTGWYDSILGGTKITFPYTVGTEDTTLFAQYKAKEYQITYQIEGTLTNDTAFFDTLLTKPNDPTKYGHDFTGWYNAATGGNKWHFTTDKMPPNNLTLYAQFTATKYNVLFNDEGTETTVPTTYDTLVTEPALPTKEGHTFVGWYDATTDGNKWNFATDKMPANELTLYARYTVNDYQITFNDQGTETQLSASYDTLLTEPTTPQKTGYTFIGWYDTASDGGNKWDFETDKVPSNDLTLYARFAAGEYKLTLNNEGTTSDQMVTYDALLTEPAPPTKIGHTFIGWYDAATGGNKWNFATDKMPAYELTLYTQYTINHYQVTFNDQGTESTLSATFDTLLTEPVAPTKAGYTFMGWKEQLSGNEWHFATDKVPARELTLVAQFKADNQTITFDVTSGDLASKPADLIAPTDSNINIDAIKKPTKPGYTFTGWYNDTTQISGTIQMPVGGLNLKARWTEADQVIHFDTAGGTGVASITAKTHESVDIDAQITTKAGYTFEGWYDGDTQVSGVITMPAGGLNLTAKWFAEDQLITFDVNGGDSTTQPEDMILATGETLDLDTLTEPTRTAYEFAGWYDGTTKYSGKITIPAGGLNLKAEWIDLIASGSWKIQAENFSISVAELEALKANGTLQSEILKRSQAKAWVEKTKDSLDPIEVDDTNLIAAVGTYQVTLSYDPATQISSDTDTNDTKVLATDIQIEVTDEENLPDNEDEEKEEIEDTEEDKAELPSTGEKVSYNILLAPIIALVGIYTFLKKKRGSLND